MPLFDNQIDISEVLGLQDALNAKATQSPEAWQDLVLATNWSNYNSQSVASPQCRKVIGSLIEVKGVIKKSTTLVANEVITTLPLGYRPSDTRYFITWSVNGYARLQVNPNGQIQLSLSGSNVVAGLDFTFGLG